ncbi:6622_t:CDS:2 [Dentiscutata erythropus]|uniref:6622_t:CDS:1 n=1 Tax=Dentiscutata erythropus TaxID=1348616 RepID=A0A9N9JTZ4_9GLOM|nr:6622_t:CDS:2 [Dentiscutata erythropus]
MAKYLRILISLAIMSLFLYMLNGAMLIERQNGNSSQLHVRSPQNGAVCGSINCPENQTCCGDKCCNPIQTCTLGNKGPNCCDPNIIGITNYIFDLSSEKDALL